MSQKPPARPSLICYHVGGSRDSGSLLAKFIRHTLGRDVAPESGPIDEMLSTCPLCSRQYLHLVDLMTATQIDALDASGLDASLTPGCTEGLLAIYQLYIGAAQRLGDPHALVLGLGIMGRVRLRMNEIEEAQRVHELATRVAEREDVAYRAIRSLSDLGAIALVRGSAQAAFDYLEMARTQALAMADGVAAGRILLLGGDALRAQDDPASAALLYGRALLEARLLGDEVALRAGAEAMRTLWRDVRGNIRRFAADVPARMSEAVRALLGPRPEGALVREWRRRDEPIEELRDLIDIPYPQANLLIIVQRTLVDVLGRFTLVVQVDLWEPRAPAEGVNVTLRTGQRRLLDGGYTDGRGQVIFRDLNAAKYVVQVASDDQVIEFSVTVSRDADTDPSDL